MGFGPSGYSLREHLSGERGLGYVLSPENPMLRAGSNWELWLGSKPGSALFCVWPCA